MTITLNGERVECEEATTLAALITRMGAPPHTAAALNGQFVPRARHAETVLKEGDDVEVVGPMQGG